MSLFMPDDGLTFAFGTVATARRASRTLLLRELTPAGNEDGASVNPGQS
jgi:hypothetical protein